MPLTKSELSAWDRRVWPFAFAGIIILGVVLQLTVAPPFWVTVVLAIGILVVYYTVLRWVARRSAK